MAQLVQGGSFEQVEFNEAYNAFTKADQATYGTVLAKMYKLQDSHECDLLVEQALKDEYAERVEALRQQIPKEMLEWYDNPLNKTWTDLTAADVARIDDADVPASDLNMVLRECRTGPAAYRTRRSRNINCGCCAPLPYLPRDPAAFAVFCQVKPYTGAIRPE